MPRLARVRTEQIMHNRQILFEWSERFRLKHGIHLKRGDKGNLPHSLLIPPAGVRPLWVVQWQEEKRRSGRPNDPDM